MEKMVVFGQNVRNTSTKELGEPVSSNFVFFNEF